MGRITAAGFADSVDEGMISLDVALHYHLKANHYPPVPAVMVPIAAAAIDAMNEDEPYRLITLPDGVTYKNGDTEVPALNIMDSFHLYGFLEGDVDDE